jgi:hypothetical protein
MSDDKEKKLIFTRKDELKYRHIGQAIEFEVKARNLKKKSNLNEVYEEISESIVNQFLAKHAETNARYIFYTKSHIYST